jgi:hypothetical protein
MSVIVANRLVGIDEVVALLEDNLPNCSVEKDAWEPTIRVRKTSHIGARISLSAASLLFTQESVQKLKETGITDPVLQSLGQSGDTAPMPVAKFGAYLEQTMNPQGAKDFLREHKAQIYGLCAHTSLITVREWDPNEVGGLLTGGNAFYISHRMKFEKELLQLLSAKVDRSSTAVPSASNCAVAIDASGSADNDLLSPNSGAVWLSGAGRAQAGWLLTEDRLYTVRGPSRWRIPLPNSVRGWVISIIVVPIIAVAAIAVWYLTIIVLVVALVKRSTNEKSRKQLWEDFVRHDLNAVCANKLTDRFDLWRITERRYNAEGGTIIIRVGSQGRRLFELGGISPAQAAGFLGRVDRFREPWDSLLDSAKKAYQGEASGESGSSR